jgi:GT2 family glycosyltransferase
MKKNDILTICVNYHNDEETINFVKELIAQQNCDGQKVIIVDNSDRSDIPSPLLKLCCDERVLLYHPCENMGYYGGAWWGMQQYLKEFSLPDWVIVCNTDLHFPIPDFFTRLLRYHAENPPAIIAPNIILELQGLIPSSETNQNPHLVRRPRRLRLHFCKWIYRYYPPSIIFEILSSLRHKIGNHLKREMVPSNFTIHSNDKPVKIYAPYGAFVIYHRSYFEAGGTLDYGAFLFGEEIFVAEIARRLGLTVLYDPRLHVMHRARTATGKLSSRKRIRFTYESTLYLIDTFFH